MIFRRRGAAVLATSRLVSPFGRSVFAVDTPTQDYVGVYDAAYEASPSNPAFAYTNRYRRGNYGDTVACHDKAPSPAFAKLWVVRRDDGGRGLAKADYAAVEVDITVNVDVPYVPSDEQEPEYINFWFAPSFIYGRPSPFVNIVYGNVWTGLGLVGNDPASEKYDISHKDTPTLDIPSQINWVQATPSWWVGPFPGTKVAAFGQLGSQWYRYSFDGSVVMPFAVAVDTLLAANDGIRVRLATDAFIAETLAVAPARDAWGYYDRSQMLELRWLKPPLVQGPLDDPEGYTWYTNVVGEFSNQAYTINAPFSSCAITTSPFPILTPQSYPIDGALRRTLEQSLNFESWKA